MGTPCIGACRTRHVASMMLLALGGLITNVGLFSQLPGQAVSRTPDLITAKDAERTGFQESGPYRPRADLRTDFVMAYGVDASIGERLARWRDAGYVPHVMTGVAWGNYQDYLDGKFDGRRHWDESQVQADGKPIQHGPTVPYMVPSVAFSKYLEQGVKRAIDAGAIAIHLEEPEFWARGGFSEAFQREWRIFYREPWQRPDSSIDAQYRASKLKYYLYQRTLDRLCSSMKEYALAEHQRDVRFYVPTHSLLNYAQWRIVSPESSLLDLPGVDGYIAQVWTGTSRTPNVYAGEQKERTFETAYLEYGVMQELVRGTTRRMWFLHDPIEDNPRHDWNDYRTNYIRTLIASLLHPEIHHYEVAPWPGRIFYGTYPRNRRGGTEIPADYATTLAVVFNQLRDMKQSDTAIEASTNGVGVFLSDSAMFQRAAPAFTTGAASNLDDPTRATTEELEMLTGFYGLTLPLLKHGIPVRPIQLDNLVRTPQYLSGFHTILLSYEFMKPMSPGLHLALAEWVWRGGTLIYVGAGTDPFHEARDWWNQGTNQYATPAEHLFETLGLGRTPSPGKVDCQRGHVILEACHPAFFSRSPENADRLRALVREGVQLAGSSYLERNSIVLRRGPYVIGAAFDESFDATPAELMGNFVDLLDPTLAVRQNVTINAGQQIWLLDLDKAHGPRPHLLAAAGRVDDWNVANGTLTYHISSPEGVNTSTRIRLDERPHQVRVDGQEHNEHTWDENSHTLLVRHAGRPEPVSVEIQGITSSPSVESTTQ